MHELAAAQELVRMILEECDTPKTVSVELGMLCTYRADPIMFYFDALKRDYPGLSDTTLLIEEVPGKIRCDECGKESVVEEAFLLSCHFCDSVRTTIIQGKDFKLKEITRHEREEAMPPKKKGSKR